MDMVDNIRDTVDVILVFVGSHTLHLKKQLAEKLIAYRLVSSLPWSVHWSPRHQLH